MHMSSLVTRYWYVRCMACPDCCVDMNNIHMGRHVSDILSTLYSVQTVPSVPRVQPLSIPAPRILTELVHITDTYNIFKYYMHPTSYKLSNNIVKVNVVMERNQFMLVCACVYVDNSYNAVNDAGCRVVGRDVQYIL